VISATCAESCYPLAIMADDKVVRFPGRFEAEIAVAERAYDVIMERLARGRLPDDVAADGDAAAVLDAIGELLHLNAMDVDGRRISRKKTEASVEALESAVYRLADWPAVPRVLAMAPIIEALEKLEVDWLASELVGLLPEQPEEAPHDDDIFEAIARISLACLRIMLRAGVWDESFEGPLRAVREWSLGRAEDDELKQTLSQAVVFHAILGRQSLLEEERRRMADAEPLPNELMAALDDFAADMTSEKLVRWSLHLVIADALAAGLVPEWAKPKHLVAAAELAVVREDDPDVELDLLKFARWARIKPKDLRTLRDKVAEALAWMPPGYEDSVEDRQEERWRVESGTMESLPVRWAADGPVEECPPYSPEAAVTRIEELRDVVWMMIDPVEPLQFVASAFRFGDDAPEVMDEETVSRIIDLWEEERVVDVDRGEDDDVEDWEDDRVDEGGGGPALVTTDGEPLVLCTGEYEFEDRDRAEIIRRLDAIAELEREQDDGSHRWVWMEERDGQNLLIGSIEVEEARLSVDTMSVARATRIGARLDEQLGELTVMIDLSTERVTPAMMARRERGAPGDGERPSVTTDDEWAVVHSAMARHYRGWLNEEIPALGGMTPREAVQDPEGRQRVVALLRNMEELQASAPEAMRGFDFGFLWRQLGLDRDEP
jgi:hypothetical protein